MKDRKILFSLRNIDQRLSDGFGNDKSILFIEKFEIKANKFTAIIGNSGSGKTTLLELLGAINRPVSGEIIYFSQSGESYNFSEIWDNSDKHSELLKNHFAFAFQQANLVSYFNVNENIFLAKMVSKDESFDEIKKKKDNNLALANLNIENIGEKPVETISGGQQQRVALARAVISDFEVLLADEPTGNVGITNEEVIFSYVRKMVDQDGKSVVTVTHNISKALEFADEIVVISGEEEGFISEKNKFEIKKDENGERYINFSRISPQPIKINVKDKQGKETKIVNPILIDILTQIMRLNPENFKKNGDIEDKNNNSREQKNERTDKDFFQKLINFVSFRFLLPLADKLRKSTNNSFINNYLSSDLKHYYHNKLFSFFVIIFSGLFAVCLFNSWDKILFEKMNNPFVNVLLCRNKSGKDLSTLKRSLLTPGMKKEYAISNVTSTLSLSLQFRDKKSTDFSHITGRTIGENSPILAQLVFDDKGINDLNGIFISRKLLKKLGYDEFDKYVILKIGQTETLIPIVKIMTFIPGDSFLITNEFYRIIESGGLHFSDTDRIRLVNLDNQKQDNFTEKISNISEDISRVFFRDEMINITFFHSHNYSYYRDILQKINSATDEKYYLYTKPRQKTKFSQDNLLTNWFFLHLDKIKNSDKLKNKLDSLDFRTDMGKISTQKNFLIISHLLRAAIFFLMLLAFIATLIYIRYSFYLHIYQQRRQIGIIRAFGITPKVFKHIFYTETVVFLVSVYFIAFVLLVIVQFANILLIKFSIIPDLYLQVFDLLTLFQFLLIVLSSFLSLRIVLQKVVSKSAGDLIYDRNTDDI